ncbi:Metalloendoproteinase 1 [Vitis vinifera]|uniref:Metalloendoproteinase 1 n=1 Tax=Vitis vinifera TaxID=29760 RepID=A0A438JIV7_VITVI|nr:Metalloendoproteinase 1 [Vitis vinifera]
MLCVFLSSLLPFLSGATSSDISPFGFSSICRDLKKETKWKASTSPLDAPTATRMSRTRCGIPDNPRATNNINSHGHSHLNIGTHFAFFPNNPRWLPGQTHLLYFLDSGSHPETAGAVANAFGVWADGSPFDGPFGILAHAFAPTDGRFHFDCEENWVIGADAHAMDLQTVATHEIGHLLGLAHTPVQEAIMYAVISPGSTKGLNQDDIDGIRALYTG